MSQRSELENYGKKGDTIYDYRGQSFANKISFSKHDQKQIGNYNDEQPL